MIDAKNDAKSFFSPFVSSLLEKHLEFLLTGFINQCLTAIGTKVGHLLGQSSRDNHLLTTS